MNIQLGHRENKELDKESRNLEQEIKQLRGSVSHFRARAASNFLLACSLARRLSEHPRRISAWTCISNRVLRVLTRRMR